MKEQYDLMSVCCGARAFGEVYQGNKEENPVGICSRCHDHTSFERVDAEGEPIKPKNRKFSPRQKALIAKLEADAREEL